MAQEFIIHAPNKPVTEVLAPAAPPPEASPPLTREQIAAVDAAFTSSHDPDLAAGLLTLWLNMPFMLEMAREHFPGREQETDTEEREMPPE